jgi:hypothetical protein
LSKNNKARADYLIFAHWMVVIKRRFAEGENVRERETKGFIISKPQ